MKTNSFLNNSRFVYQETPGMLETTAETENMSAEELKQDVENKKIMVDQLNGVVGRDFGEGVKAIANVEGAGVDIRRGDEFIANIEIEKINPSDREYVFMCRGHEYAYDTRNLEDAIAYVEGLVKEFHLSKYIENKELPGVKVMKTVVNDIPVYVFAKGAQPTAFLEAKTFKGGDYTAYEDREFKNPINLSSLEDVDKYLSEKLSA